MQKFFVIMHSIIYFVNWHTVVIKDYQLFKYTIFIICNI